MACMGGVEDGTVAGTCPECGTDVNAQGEAVTYCFAAESDCQTCDESFCEGAC